MGMLWLRVCIAGHYVSLVMSMAIAIRLSQTSVARLQGGGGINGKASSVPVSDTDLHGLLVKSNLDNGIVIGSAIWRLVSR